MCAYMCSVGLKAKAGGDNTESVRVNGDDGEARGNDNKKEVQVCITGFEVQGCR